MREKEVVAAGYCRVSTPMQVEGLSLDVQQEQIEKYIRSRGWKLYKMFIETGYSGKDFERPRFQEMLRHLRAGKFGVIVVPKIDRFARNIRLLLEIVENDLKPNNVQLVSVSENIDTTNPAGNTLFQIMGIFAAMERERISERITDSHRKKALTGPVGGSKLGYKFDKNGECRIDSKGTDIVRTIFRLFVKENKTSVQIANYLREKDIKSVYGKYMCFRVVQRILRNEAYIGCFIYARVSTQDQARGLSIDVQIDQIKEYAASQPGWNLIQIFTEPGASGGDFERPGFKKLKKKIEAGEVDIIVVTKLDRLVRSLLHLLRFIENDLEPRGIKFVSISEGIDSSQKGMSRVFMQVLSAFSEMERSRIRERCGEGRQKNASLGRLNGPAPYGYKKSEDKIVIIPEEARVVKRLFVTFNKGDRGALSIAEEFALEGIVSRKGKPFTHSSLLTMLKNEFYTGRFVWGKKPRSGVTDESQYVVIEKNHPAIISAADFERTQFILDHRISGFPTRERGEFILTGLLFDQHGHRMKGINKKLSSKTIGYYGCSVYYGTGPGTGIRYCRQRRVESAALEKIILEKVKERLKVLSEQVEDTVADRLFTDDKFQQMEATLKVELQETQARASRLFEGFIDGAVPKNKFEEANRQLATDEDYIKGKIVELEIAKRRQLALRYMDRESLKKLMESFEYFSGIPFFAKKKLLHQMMEKIVINSRKGMPVQIEKVV